MRNKILAMLALAILLALSMVQMAWATTVDVWDGVSVDTFWYDNNKQANEYTISSAAQLAGLAKLVNDYGIMFENKVIILNSDIDLNYKPWIAIGPGWTEIVSGSSTKFKNIYFKGTFDGNNHLIDNLSVNVTDKPAGLFGYVSKCLIQNLNVKGSIVCNHNSDISYSVYPSGGIVSYSDGGNIINCSFIGYVEGDSSVGGIVGTNSGTVERCVFNGDISAYQLAGGIVGDNHGIIQYCYNIGSVNVDNGGVGGIAGSSTEKIVQCFNKGSVIGSHFAGGIVGSTSNADAEIANSYNTGNVSININHSGCGGIVGYASESVIINNCYNIGKISGKLFVSGLVGEYNVFHEPIITNCFNLPIDGVLITDSTINEEAFENQNTFLNWDFNNIWEMSNKLKRPILKNNLENSDSNNDNDNPSVEDNPSEESTLKFYPENGKIMDLDNPANGTSSVNYADGKLRIFFDKELANSGGNRATLDFSVGALEIHKATDDSVVYAVEANTDLPFWGENGVYNKAVRLENATAKLEYGTQYYVTMPAGFIKFADGTTSPAIAKGDWSFTTKDKSGNIPEIKPVNKVNVEIPKDGFAVVVMDEDFKPINGATVTAQNLLMSPSAKTDNGIVTFNRLPDVAKDTATVRIKVEMDGYPTLLVPREVKKGSFVSVVYKKSDDLQIYSVEGTIDGVTKDLLYNYCYFKENVNKVEAAEDKSNVKEFVISVGTSGNTHIDKYQIIQNGKVVLESKSPIIKIPVYTGTPTVPDSFGSNYLIDTLKAGQNVYLRLVDDNGNVSKQTQLAIKISQPSKATEVFPEGKGSIDIGKKLKINVPSNIPILGDSELEFGLDELPF